MEHSSHHSIKNGTYKYVHGGYGGGEITIAVKETPKSFVFQLIENTCRYSPAHIDMLFKDSNKVTINKEKSKHAMRFSDTSDDWFVIYPFQAGIPFAFDLVKNISKS